MAAKNPYLILGQDALKYREDFKLVGRDEPLKRLSVILMRSKSNSVLLSGLGGVGCSALCFGLQASKSDPTTPYDIVRKRLAWLKTNSLFSSGDNEIINKAWQDVVHDLSNTPSSVLIIEDAKVFIEAANRSGCSHFLNSLILSVKSSKMQVIMETRDDDIEFVYKSHSDISECFTLFDLEEPDAPSLEKIAFNMAEKLSKETRIRIAPETVKAAIELTTKYPECQDRSLSRAQPERTFNLLDLAMANYRQVYHGTPPDILRLENELKSDKLDRLARKTAEDTLAELRGQWKDTQQDLRVLYGKQRDLELQLNEVSKRLRDEQAKLGPQSDNDKPTALDAMKKLAGGMQGFATPEMVTLQDQKRQLEAAIEAVRQEHIKRSSIIDSQLELTRDMVLAEYSIVTGISVEKLNENEKAKLLNLKDDLLQVIYGQDQAVELMANTIKVHKGSRRKKTKPACYLLAGPSGVGKTEITKQIARLLQMQWLPMDMGQYQEKNAVAKMIGAPPGYEGYSEDGGILTRRIRKNSNTLILFDEVEKAHPDVFDVLLAIMDEGRMLDPIGREIDFRNCILVFTTNLGQSRFLDTTIDYNQAMSGLLDEDLNFFRPEFLNRINGRKNILGFNRLELPSVERIVKRTLKEIDDTYEDMRLQFREQSIKEFCQVNYKAKEGARGLPGIINTTLEALIVDRDLRDENNHGDFEVIYDVEKHEFRLLDMSQLDPLGPLAAKPGLKI